MKADESGTSTRAGTLGIQPEQVGRLVAEDHGPAHIVSTDTDPGFNNNNLKIAFVYGLNLIYCFNLEVNFVLSVCRHPHFIEECLR